MTYPQDIQDLGFDPEAVRAKYASERDRRVRREGAEQYIEAAGAFARYGDDDPHARGEDMREPQKEDIEVLVVGGGFSGLMVSAELRKHGIEDVWIVEAGSDFGGTWYWNRYPGAQCDIESYIYLPMLEETGYIPKEKYAYQPEIYAHVQRLAAHFGLRDRVIFRTRVTELRWDEEIVRWRVTTDRGDAFGARFVINATGPADRPKLPGIPGIESFSGKMFHTSRWDYGYTGGDTSGGLRKLADKRVAIIGTGATAIQVVPHVGQAAKQLYVFQRTPSSVDVRGNRPTDPEWAANLNRGWQRERQDNFNAIMNREPVAVDLVQDMWTDLIKYMPRRDAARPFDKQAASWAELADMQKMHEIRARVDTIVTDRFAAEALKPWYPRYCKRPTFHDDYLPTFNRPNVTLIDTSDTRGVERMTPRGVVVDGIEYEVDCIIFATGFEITTGAHRKLPISIVGRGGSTIAERWVPDLSTFHGHSVHGFPNWFFLGGGQNGLSANYTSVLAAQAEHLAYIVKEVRDRGAIAVQPTREAETEWVQTIRALATAAVEAYAACTPGYYNNEGQIGEGKGRALGEVYGPGLNAFNRLLKAWREDGTMKGLQLEMPGITALPRTAAA
ncbi:flavin-containing monooxygenase [Chelatococcus reniformis]|uniref:Monooxygenase n=1 Tax=Chelatococcus reniformis TaxID=1494448 RepID=A0A916XMV7_9HYPH|nr:NAD(P)/FAD-dependent oxidoreductase [Chelatococcus reniformis]GGC88043.1 monooxygenase [Chelatococcus reniformis]